MTTQPPQERAKRVTMNAARTALTVGALEVSATDPKLTALLKFSIGDRS
jgi:hypothetical protein